MASHLLGRLLAAALLAALAGCSPVRLLNDFVPTHALQVRGDVAYGGHPRQRLDVYTPRDAPDARPVVVFFYGGYWRSGSRANYLFLAEALTSRGFVVVVPDYRLHPEVTFPAFVEDAAAAVAWTARHAAEFGGDPQHLFVMGHSAGAHLAAMVSLDARFLAAQDLSPAAIAGFIGLAGPYDFLPLTTERLQRIFPEETRARSQPIDFVSANAPRALLVTGDSDTTVRPGNTQRLAARLRAAGVAVREVSYPDEGHITIVTRLAAPLRVGGALLDEIERFVRGEASLAR
jgi:acetyl esterase/lipase